MSVFGTAPVPDDGVAVVGTKATAIYTIAPGRHLQLQVWREDGTSAFIAAAGTRHIAGKLRWRPANLAIRGLGGHAHGGYAIEDVGAGFVAEADAVGALESADCRPRLPHIADSDLALVARQLGTPSPTGQHEPTAGWYNAQNVRTWAESPVALQPWDFADVVYAFCSHGLVAILLRTRESVPARCGIVLRTDGRLAMPTAWTDCQLELVESGISKGGRSLLALVDRRAGVDALVHDVRIDTGYDVTRDLAWLQLAHNRGPDCWWPAVCLPGAGTRIAWTNARVTFAADHTGTRQWRRRR